MIRHVLYFSNIRPSRIWNIALTCTVNLLRPTHANWSTLFLRLLTTCLILTLVSASRDVTHSPFQRKVVIIVHTIAVLLMRCKATCIFSYGCRLGLRYINWQSAWLDSRFSVMMVDMLEFMFGSTAVVAAVGVCWHGDIWDNGQRSH